MLRSGKTRFQRVLGQVPKQIPVGGGSEHAPIRTQHDFDCRDCGGYTLICMTSRKSASWDPLVPCANRYSSCDRDIKPGLPLGSFDHLAACSGVGHALRLLRGVVFAVHFCRRCWACGLCSAGGDPVFINHVCCTPRVQTRLNLKPTAPDLCSIASHRSIEHRL